MPGVGATLILGMAVLLATVELDLMQTVVEEPGEGELGLVDWVASGLEQRQVDC